MHLIFLILGQKKLRFYSDYDKYLKKTRFIVFYSILFCFRESVYSVTQDEKKTRFFSAAEVFFLPLFVVVRTTHHYDRRSYNKKSIRIFVVHCRQKEENARIPRLYTKSGIMWWISQIGWVIGSRSYFFGVLFWQFFQKTTHTWWKHSTKKRTRIFFLIIMKNYCESQKLSFFYSGVTGIDIHIHIKTKKTMRFFFFF